MNNISTEKKFLGHPWGLFYLFFAELWERFSFYGMRALLTLYMVEQMFVALEKRDSIAIIIYASYGSLVYAVTVLGGKISDSLYGYRNSIILGGIFIAIGHFILVFNAEWTFFIGLSFIVVGTGYFKSNISTFVSTLYSKGDIRQDSGFTIFYMGINIGGFIAPLLCAYLAVNYGWHYGFGAAGVGMILGLFCFLFGLKSGVFGDKGLPHYPEKLQKKYIGIPMRVWIPLLSLCIVPFITMLISNYEIYTIGNIFEGSVVKLLFFVLLASILLYLFFLIRKQTKEYRNKLIVAVLLTCFMSFFWAFHELSGSIITLFVGRNVNTSGWMSAASSNALNPFFIILLSFTAPFFWGWLSKYGKNPRTPYKFVGGLALIGFAFLLISTSRYFADEQGYVPFVFVIIMYFFISAGEIFMSPVGLSKINDLSPIRIRSFMMGVWFLSSSFAFMIGGIIGKYFTIEHSPDTNNTNGIYTLDIYLNGFEKIGYASLGFAALIFILSPVMKKWMKEIH
ncbi:MAG: oligopeptide:H+ symporter [Chitinophagaceae bacterium]|nr:oligopeptide:H+ symporter [Chitinophagaceae bacterium]